MSAGKPDLNMLGHVNRFIDGRTLRSVQLRYEGANKQELIDSLTKLQEAWNQDIPPMVEIGQQGATLAGDATIEQVREVFNKMDAEDRKLEAIELE